MPPADAADLKNTIAYCISAPSCNNAIFAEDILDRRIVFDERIKTLSAGKRFDWQQRNAKFKYS